MVESPMVAVMEVVTQWQSSNKLSQCQTWAVIPAVAAQLPLVLANFLSLVLKPSHY